MTKGSSITAETDPSGIVNEEVHLLRSAADAPGVAVALLYDNQRLFYNIGDAVREPQIPITENTFFGMGSVDKVFTATMLAYNVVLGNMQLSDPVVKYLPQEVSKRGSEDIKKVTLQQLATHTSGMPSQGPDKPAYFLFNELPPSESILNWWINFRAEPGVGNCYRYSNVGFVTLGYAVGGPHFHNNQLLFEQVTSPLNMSQTASYITPPGGEVAQGYVGTPTRSLKPWNTGPGLKTTTHDLMNFLSACVFSDQSTPLGQALELTKTRIPFLGKQCDGGNPPGIGLAWNINPMQISEKTYVIVAKDGMTSMGGFSAWIGFIPEVMGIALLSNKAVTDWGSAAPRSPGKTGRSILMRLLSNTV